MAIAADRSIEFARATRRLLEWIANDQGMKLETMTEQDHYRLHPRALELIEEWNSDSNCIGMDPALAEIFLAFDAYRESLRRDANETLSATTIKEERGSMEMQFPLDRPFDEGSDIE